MSTKLFILNSLSEKNIFYKKINFGLCLDGLFGSKFFFLFLYNFGLYLDVLVEFGKDKDSVKRKW